MGFSLSVIFARYANPVRGSGKDWTLMLQSYLILLLELLHEDWMQRLLSQYHYSLLCVQRLGFRIQSQTLKRFKHGYVTA